MTTNRSSIHLQQQKSDGITSRIRNSASEYPFLNPTHFTFDCIYPDCENKFTLTNDLYDHIRLDHGKDLNCPRCDTKFKCMASLVYHNRTHTGNKPYICPLPSCKFITATKGNLKAHLLSNQHKDSMNLKLLNVILSLDTNHGRPERCLHAPREPKKRRKSQVDSNMEPADKRRRLSLNTEGTTSAQNPMFLSLNGPLPNPTLPNANNNINLTPTTQIMQFPPFAFTPLTTNNLVFDTSNFYSQLPATPIQTNGPFGIAAPPSAMDISNRSSRNRNSVMINTDNGELLSSSDRDSTASDFDNTSRNSIHGVHGMEGRRSTNTSLNQRWETFNFNNTNDGNIPDLEKEDLTIRIKVGLLQSIEKAENIRDINNFEDSDKFLMDINGMQSTAQFYGKSSFGMDDSASVELINIHGFREESDDSLLLEPPLLF